MAIVYDWYENPNAEGESEERGLHPRPLLNGKVSMEQLYYRVHERSSLSVGDAKSAIDTLTQLCGEELREGREVQVCPSLEQNGRYSGSIMIKKAQMDLIMHTDIPE